MNNTEDHRGWGWKGAEERLAKTLDVAVKITVPLVVAALLGVTGLLWRINERITRVEERQTGILQKLIEPPPADYRNLVAEQFRGIADKLTRIETKIDKLEQ